MYIGIAGGLRRFARPPHFTTWAFGLLQAPELILTEADGLDNHAKFCKYE
jgi:hypothetical protein